MKRTFYGLTAFLLMCSVALLASIAVGQSGGPYRISQSVISGGGNESTGGQFQLVSTAGQAQAAPLSSGGQYGLEIGFWTSPALTPTAASVAVSGRVLTTSGRGIPNITLTLTDAQGLSRTTRTGSFGFYRFDNLAAGQLYILTIKSRKIAFENATRFLNVVDNMADVDFIGGAGDDR